MLARVLAGALLSDTVYYVGAKSTTALTPAYRCVSQLSPDVQPFGQLSCLSGTRSVATFSNATAMRTALMATPIR
jgi:hypothetical protein